MARWPGAPRPQAWLTLATVRRVQGRYADSDLACQQVATNGAALHAQACLAENAARAGMLERILHRLLRDPVHHQRHVLRPRVLVARAQRNVDLCAPAEIVHQRAQRGGEPEVVEYLKTPPSRARLQGLLAAMGMSARAIRSSSWLSSRKFWPSDLRADRAC